MTSCAQNFKLQVTAAAIPNHFLGKSSYITVRMPSLSEAFRGLRISSGAPKQSKSKLSLFRTMSVRVELSSAQRDCADRTLWCNRSRIQMLASAQSGFALQQRSGCAVQASFAPSVNSIKAVTCGFNFLYTGATTG